MINEKDFNPIRDCKFKSKLIYPGLYCMIIIIATLTIGGKINNLMKDAENCTNRVQVIENILINKLN